jgi:hypothetical protein
LALLHVIFGGYGFPVLQFGHALHLRHPPDVGRCGFRRGTRLRDRAKENQSA